MTVINTSLPSADAAPLPNMPRGFLVVFCGLVFAINPFSCDILLPALFAIARDFDTTIARAQATIPIYLMIAAAGQLLFGPLSDRFGRRPILIVGLVLYTTGSACAALAPTIDWLLAARVVQGLGASCAIVLARAILRDTHAGDELARALTMSMAIFTAGPLLAPLLGALVMAIQGWRLAFWGLVVLGCALTALTVLRLGETNVALDPQALSATRLFTGAGRVLGEAQSRRFILVIALLNWNIVVLISSMPRVFKSAFGYEGAEFAFLFAFATLGIIVGQALQHRAIARFGLKATLGAGTVFFAIAVGLMALAAATHTVSVALFAALMFLFNMAFLAVAAICMSLVLEPHRDIAGLAAAIFGSLTHFIGSGLALLTLPLLDGTLGQWSLFQVTIVGLACAVVLTWPPLRAVMLGGTWRATGT